jgi:hypothetical protein
MDGHLFHMTPALGERSARSAIRRRTLSAARTYTDYDARSRHLSKHRRPRGARSVAFLKDKTPVVLSRH